ncbi:MAG: DsbC family protein [Nitrosomonadales bacterium]|nr:DsbC family protein [Nitrosomonadales bacterium]
MFKSLLLLLATLSCAYAGEAEVKDTLQKNHPQLGKIEQVNKTPISGLYEVVTQSQLFYTDDKAQYLIDGSLYELKSMRNLTDERSRQMFSVNFNSLPLDLALKRVKGNGSRKLAYFTDPNCGFCKKLERELQKVNNVTLYLFLYPVFPGSDEKVQGVWCSKDKLKAWDEMMLNNVTPPSGNCGAPIAKVLEWGKKLKVNGTPTLIMSDGTVLPGFLPATELEKALADAASR